MNNARESKRGLTPIEVIYGLASTIGLGVLAWLSLTTISHSNQLALQSASIGDIPEIRQDSKEAKIQAGIAAGIVKELARQQGVPSAKIQTIENNVRQNLDSNATTTTIILPTAKNYVSTSF